MGETEPSADDPAVPEQLLDLVGPRRGADVEILRRAVEQEIADAAADDVPSVAEAPKTLDDFFRVLVEEMARDRAVMELGALWGRSDGRGARLRRIPFDLFSNSEKFPDVLDDHRVARHAPGQRDYNKALTRGQ